MIAAACAIALACVVSMSHSAPLACQDLVRPLDHLDPRHLEGKWAVVAGGRSNRQFLEEFRQSDSASVNFYSNTSDTPMSYTLSILRDGKCLYTSFNISLGGSSFTYDGTDKSNLSANFAHTSCHDCMLMHLNVQSGRRQHFYLFSRRRQLEQKEIEEFNAQMACLNMPPPVVMDPTKDLCPEEKASDPENLTENTKTQTD